MKLRIKQRRREKDDGMIMLGTFSIEGVAASFAEAYKEYPTKFFNNNFYAPIRLPKKGGITSL